MGEKYPFYHPLYVVPERRNIKEIKRDYNKYLKKFEMSKTKVR